MSNMDSERCWGQPAGCKEDYDCGPDSGLLFPAVYTVDPGEVRIIRKLSRQTVLYY